MRQKYVSPDIVSKMKRAISNIALPAYEHDRELNMLQPLGFSGLEVAPSRTWRETFQGLTPSAVSRYRRTVEDAGLSIVGLHSLFFDQPNLGLFRDPDTRSTTLTFLEHLSAVCRDLGGRTLIWGSGRNRELVSSADACSEALDFIGALCQRIEGHGTCFCFEPLGPNDSDFINSARESFKIAEAINHSAFAVQLDAKALVENNELDESTIRSVRSRLVHVHVNEPGLGILDQHGVDHAAFGAYLVDINYDGYVSLEQRMLDEEHPLEPVRRSAQVMAAHY